VRISAAVPKGELSELWQMSTFLRRPDVYRNFREVGREKLRWNHLPSLAMINSPRALRVFVVYLLVPAKGRAVFHPWQQAISPW